MIPTWNVLNKIQIQVKVTFVHAKSLISFGTDDTTLQISTAGRVQMFYFARSVGRVTNVMEQTTPPPKKIRNMLKLPSSIKILRY